MLFLFLTDFLEFRDFCLLGAPICFQLLYIVENSNGSDEIVLFWFDLACYCFLLAESCLSGFRIMVVVNRSSLCKCAIRQLQYPFSLSACLFVFFVCPFLGCLDQ